VAVRVLALSDKKGDPLTAQAEELLARTVRRYGVSLVLLKPEKRGKGVSDDKVREAEGKRLLAASEGCARVALDAGGRSFDTPAFAAALERRLADGRDVAFLIGGATGHSPEALARADEIWSLSPLTFPHRLALLLVAEQVYRAGEIERGGPYAK
jgi:23S rRNA (pseudouridine1915-N3)-methyltransferase